MALYIIAKITPKTGHEIELQQALEQLIAPTREEQGCISYQLLANSGDGEPYFIMNECWENQESLDIHIKTIYFSAFIKNTEHILDSLGIQQLSLIA